MILITGAAGKTGRALIKALLAKWQGKPIEPIRVLVRRPEQIELMLHLGVQEVLVGDHHSEEILSQATQGIRIIYHIPPNVDPDELVIGQLVIKAARSAGVERFVYHSVLHPHIEAMPHHWQKMRVEEQLFTSGLSFTILQPAVYMQNVLAQRNEVINQGIYPVPYALNTKLGMVDLNDVAEVAASILTTKEHTGAIYELAGDEVLSQDDIALSLGQAIGHPIRAEFRSRESWEKTARAGGMKDYQIDTLLRMFVYYEQNGFWGNSNVISWLLGRQPTSFKTFLEKNYPQ